MGLQSFTVFCQSLNFLHYSIQKQTSHHSFIFQLATLQILVVQVHVVLFWKALTVWSTWVVKDVAVCLGSTVSSLM